MDLINKFMPKAEVKDNFMDHESFENTEKAERMLGFKAKNIWRVNINQEQKEAGVEKVLGY